MWSVIEVWLIYLGLIVVVVGICDWLGVWNEKRHD